MALDTYETSDFPEAIYLRKSGITFIGVNWLSPQRAVFIFKNPPEEVMSAWAKGEDGGVRVTLAAADFLRDVLRRDR